MLLRILAVLFVALAAARPVGRLVGAGHAPTALAIVLDNSLEHVDDRRRRTAVSSSPRCGARARLVAATPSDRLWLVTADGRVVGGSTSAVGDAIQRARADGRGRRPARARSHAPSVSCAEPACPRVTSRRHRRAGARLDDAPRRSRESA